MLIAGKAGVGGDGRRRMGAGGQGEGEAGTGTLCGPACRGALADRRCGRMEAHRYTPGVERRTTAYGGLLEHIRLHSPARYSALAQITCKEPLSIARMRFARFRALRAMGGRTIV